MKRTKVFKTMEPMEARSLNQVALELSVCRCCLRATSHERLVKRTVAKIFSFFTKHEASDDMYMWVCWYCSSRVAQFVRFVKSVNNSTEVLATLQREKSYFRKETSQEILDIIKLESKIYIPSLTKHETGLVELQGNTATDFEGSSNYVIEYPKPTLKQITEYTEEVKIELSPIHDEDYQIHFDSDQTEEIPTKLEHKKPTKNEREKKLKDDKGKRISTHKDLEEKMSGMKFKIVYLTIEEQRQEIESNKRSGKYLNSAYKCGMCGSGFVLRESYENHMFKHTEARGAHSCAVCGLRFSRADLLQCHSRDHARHFVCTLCGVAANNYTDCDRHYARCAGFRGCVACQHCGKLVRDEYALQKHTLLIHLRSKKFTCDYCKKDFKQKVSLQTHIRRHTGERPHACASCGARFASPYCLKQHALMHAPRGSHYCVECDKRYRSAGSLRQHLARSPRHKATRPEFKHACCECNKRYFSRRELDAHVTRAHAPPAPRAQLQCSHCPKVYAHAHVLRRHERRVHLGVQPPRAHVCQHCGKAFTERFRLVNHIRTHTGERPFSCDLCPAAFTHKSAIYGHKKAKHAPPPPARDATV